MESRLQGFHFASLAAILKLGKKRNWLVEIHRDEFNAFSMRHNVGCEDLYYISAVEAHENRFVNLGSKKVAKNGILSFARSLIAIAFRRQPCETAPLIFLVTGS